MALPIRTAREYPTTGSHGVPLEIFFRFMIRLVNLFWALVRDGLWPCCRNCNRKPLASRKMVSLLYGHLTLLAATVFE
jgi:hypothetical protein